MQQFVVMRFRSKEDYLLATDSVLCRFMFPAEHVIIAAVPLQQRHAPPPHETVQLLSSNEEIRALPCPKWTSILSLAALAGA